MLISQDEYLKSRSRPWRVSHKPAQAIFESVILTTSLKVTSVLLHDVWMGGATNLKPAHILSSMLFYQSEAVPLQSCGQLYPAARCLSAFWACAHQLLLPQGRQNSANKLQEP